MPRSVSIAGLHSTKPVRRTNKAPRTQADRPRAMLCYTVCAVCSNLIRRHSLTRQPNTSLSNEPMSNSVFRVSSSTRNMTGIINRRCEVKCSVNVMKWRSSVEPPLTACTSEWRPSREYGAHGSLPSYHPYGPYHTHYQSLSGRRESAMKKRYLRVHAFQWTAPFIKQQYPCSPRVLRTPSAFQNHTPISWLAHMLVPLSNAQLAKLM